jgi:hypothetical protein
MRQRLTIDIPDKRYQQEIQSKVKNLLEQKLNEILEKYFSSHVPNDVVITLDQITVNLADTTPDLLEESILQQIHHKLPAVIKEQVDLAIKDPLKKRITPLPDAKLQAVKHYLLYGYFAWWMPAHDEKIIEDLYTEIYYKTPAAIKDLWAELNDKPLAIQRFIEQFSSTTVQKSILLLRPGQAQHMLNISEDFSKLHPLLLKITSASAQKKLHTATKYTVLAQSIKTLSTNKSFNEINFLKICLQQLAKEFNTSYSVLVTNLSHELSKQTLSSSLASNLASNIIRLHDTEIINNQHSKPITYARLSTLIKQLDEVLASGENINKHQLSSTINEIFAQSKNPAIKSVLTGYLTSISHTRQLTQCLPTEDFAKLIEVIQPAIQNAFVISKQIWQAVIPQEQKNHQLIEQLTVKYLNTKRSSVQQEPHAYISYLVGKLHSYESNNLEKWAPFIKENVATLEKRYTSDLVKTLLKKLPTNNIQSPNHAVLPLNKFFAETLDKIQEHLELPSHQPLTILLDNLYEDLSFFIQENKPLLAELEKNLLNNVESVFKYVITDSKRLQWAKNQFILWIKQQISKAEPHNSENSVQIFQNKLAVLLSKQDSSKRYPSKEHQTNLEAKPEHITILLIKDFFTHQLLPHGYVHQSALMSDIIRQLVYIPDFQYELYNLLQQQSIRKQLVKNVVPAAKGMLLNTLVPMSINTRKIYEQILFKADVLRTDAQIDKQALLEDIFLESASQSLEISEEDFIQYSLLVLSYNAQLPKHEIYRRINLSAQKYAPTIPLIHKLQQLSPLFETAELTIADVLDKAFLPIYNLLKGLLSAQDLTPDLYAQFLAFMKNIIANRLTTEIIDKKLYKQIRKLFPMLLAHQRQHLFELIKKKLKEVADKQLQTLQTSWLHFLHTGELLEGYKSASELFNNLLLGTSLKNENHNNNLATIPLIHSLPDSHIQQLTTLLITTLKTPHVRKRLIASLPTEDLEKVVQLVIKEKSKIVINYIHNIYEIWNHTGIVNITPQESKLAWWEATLPTLVSTKTSAFSKKVWLTESLSVFATLLELPFTTVLSSLTAYAKANAKPFRVARESTEELDEILINIEQYQFKTVKEEAEKAWPAQPAFQTLHQLFNIGFSSFNRHTPTSLEALEQQVSNLINQQVSSVKKFFYTYPKPVILSQQIVYYFSAPLVKELIYCLDTKAHPFIQQYIDFSILYQADFYEAQGIDAFSWRKYTDIATLSYLLEKKDTAFNKRKYLLRVLETSQKHTKQDIQSVLQSLINYHTQHKHTTVHEEIIQQLSDLLITDNVLDTAIKNSLKEEEDTETAFKMVQPTSPRRHDYQKELAIKSEYSHKEKPQKEIKLYIKNSGLIFLWPFIEELLEKQDLLKHQVFYGNLERSNAVHTLQYLVTEQLSTPDWRIILNKLLCGMSYNDIPFAGYYLWDKKAFAKRVIEEQEKALAEYNNQPTKKKHKKQLNKKSVIELPEEIVLLKRNTEELLTKVLAEWKSLKKLERYEPFKKGFGIQDLKKYILQRDGLLQYVDQGEKGGYWHLTITWEEYDGDITKTPWPINKICLPFMKEELVVFWTPN